MSPDLMVENAPEVILDQRSALTSAFDASGDFSYTGLQSFGVHFAEVDRMVGFHLHGERFSIISKLWDSGHLLVVKTPEVHTPRVT
jgi:hypothetical protein